MINFIQASIYNILLGTSGFWYVLLRWTYLQDKQKYWWAYLPMNLFTAFLSAIFIIVSFVQFNVPIFKIDKIALILNYVAYFLLIRNIYYTCEDVYDYFLSINHKNKEQILFILIDVLMIIVPLLYFYFYKK